MVVLVFGQIGLRKKQFLEKVKEVAVSCGKRVEVHHVGSKMYACDPTIRPGRILEKSLSQLTHIRARVVDGIANSISREDAGTCHIVNTHATFRWSNGLFLGYTKSEIESLHPDCCVTLIDNVQNVRRSLNLRESKPAAYSLKDILHWREEEILASDLASEMMADCRHLIVPMGGGPEFLLRLLLNGGRRTAYLSYPISLVREDEATQRLVAKLREEIGRRLIAYDPYWMTEGQLKETYSRAKRAGKKRVSVPVPRESGNLILPTEEIGRALTDINGQIVSRDFRLIQQSDLVVALVPERNGQPQLSIGVQSELDYAQELTLDRFVIWPSPAGPSPFLRPTRLFHSLEELCQFLDS